MIDFLPGIRLAQTGDTRGALLWFEQILRDHPTNGDAALNVGAALADLGRYDEALPPAEFAAQTLATPLAIGNYAICLYRCGRFAEAAVAFQHVIDTTPQNATMQYNLAFVLLSQRQYRQGWRQIAWRKQTAKWMMPEPLRTLPLWQGEPLDDSQRLAVFHEQGYGDSLMLSRYLNWVKPRVSHLEVVCPPPLQNLFRESFAVAAHAAPSLVTHQCSLFDLPAIFDITEDNIPRGHYLSVSGDAAVQKWGERLQALTGLRVGLVWSGSSRPDPVSQLTDARRSIELTHLRPLLDIPDINFVSLQKGDGARQLTSDYNITDWTDELNDFADTAGLISLLDLVISVDTSVVHLAAGMGRPVWLMNRFDSCWRWLADPNTWYNSVTEFRQPSPGDWVTVIDRVGQRLAEAPRL